MLDNISYKSEFYLRIEEGDKYSYSNVPEGMKSLAFDSGVDRFLLNYTGNLTVHESENLWILIHGELVGEYQKAIHLTEELETQELSKVVSGLNGSFTVCILDKRTSLLSVVTDRLNTKRVFYGKQHGITLISTSVHFIGKELGADLDEAGVVSSIVNGVPFLDQTMYKGVKVLADSSIHEFHGHELSSKKYWTYTFTNEKAGNSLDNLSLELEELLVSSVENRVAGRGDLIVSLSGGFDTTSIVSILNQRLGIKDVRCFSYIYGETVEHSDAYVAREMAEVNGYSHRSLQSYGGNIVDAILQNALLGQGLTNYCDEVNAYTTNPDIFGASPDGYMLVGDTYFLPKVEAYTVKDTFSSIGFYDSTVLKGIENLFDAELKIGAFRKWDEACARALAEVPTGMPMSDLKDILYFQHRLNSTLMPWRDLVQSSFVNVGNPYLDNQIVDFFTKVGPEFRGNDRMLYKHTLKRMFPDVFAIPRAKFNNVKPDWASILGQHADEISDRLLSVSSPLDKLIPVDNIRQLLEQVNNPELNIAKVIGDKGRALQHYSPFLNKVLSKYKLLPSKQLSKWQVLLRVLVLRESFKVAKF